ncbi:DUF397 domain-containing protein [Actinocrispum sp. NPDC049592]|uniref:DUF397 domain-containing protein n=1 Tax=Actinocrispum sp. NPDC049592 TaxID=3154835 RepID=UPI003426B3AF
MLTWRKSSYSRGQGDCVEVAWMEGVHTEELEVAVDSCFPRSDVIDCFELDWTSSSFSQGDGVHRIEIACGPTTPSRPTVLIRDSKNPDGPYLSITHWRSFLAYVRCL